MYNDIYIKPKVSLYNINIYGNEVREENQHYTCISDLFLDSIVNLDKRYYPQIFLEECKYTIKTKKIINTINEELVMNESGKD